MKKAVLVFLSILFVFTLAISASALTAPRVTPSADLMKLSYVGKEYSRFNATLIEDELYKELEIFIPDALREEVKNLVAYSNEENTIIRMTYYYNDGATFTASYLRDDMVEEYNAMRDGNVDFIVDFGYPEGNSFVTPAKFLMSEEETHKTTINIEKAEQIFEVYAESGDKSIVMPKGVLIIMNDNYYYYDYADNERFAKSKYTNIFVPKYDVNMPVKRIKNSELKADIEAALEKYYKVEFGFLHNKDFVSLISNIFLVILFIVLPAALTVLFAVFAIVKKRNRALYIIVSVMAAVLTALSVAISLIV